nr:glycosyltransferase family 2 protein [Sphingomonas crocodyli]
MPRPHAILVVIPTLNEARHIAQVIADLTAEPLPEADLLFVVADGGSSDGTQDIVGRIAATRSDLLLLDNPKKLQSAAVNLAVEQYGEGRDLLIRCDAHADYPAGFLKSLVDAFDRGEADAIVVPMDSVGTTCFQRAVGWVSDSKVGSGGSAHRGGAASGYVDHGHHALFRMDSFRAAGGYDPSFTHNEDAELDCRQRALGSRIFLDADIRLRYAPRATPGKLARQYFITKPLITKNRSTPELPSISVSRLTPNGVRGISRWTHTTSKAAIARRTCRLKSNAAPSPNPQIS